MSRVVVKYRPLDNDQGSLVYTLAHNGETCDVDSGLKVRAGEWDSIISRLRPTSGNREREKYLRNVGYQVESDLRSISTLMREMERVDCDYNLSSVTEAFNNADWAATLGQALERYLDFSKIGKRSAGRYKTAVKNLLRFKMVDDLPLSEIVPTLINDFKGNLIQNHSSRYTIITHFTALAVIYNKAVEWGMVLDARPFGDVPSKIPDYEFSQKGIFPLYVRRLRELDLTDSPELALVRDLLLMAYYSGLTLGQLGTLSVSATGPDRYVCLHRDGVGEMDVEGSPEFGPLVVRHADTTPSGYLLPVFLKRAKKISSRRNYDSRSRYARQRFRPALDSLSELIDYPGSLSFSAATASAV